MAWGIGGDRSARAGPAGLRRAARDHPPLGLGLGIARAIQARSREVLRVEEGAVYPALHRLERDGLLE